MKRLLTALFILTISLLIGFYYHVSTSFNASVDDTYPVRDITIKSDSAKVAHGKYLSLGPAHCAHCHSSPDNLQDVEMGKEVPMTGGFVFQLPLGNIYSTNITSDVETGIGGFSDGQLYRMMRHNVRADGQVCIDLMPFFNMSEYDIESIICYLRTLAPIKNEIPENEYNFLGKVIRTFALKASIPATEPIDFITRDTTVEYGKYMSEAVANCMGCHTDRDLKTGEFIGEPYAGGMTFGPDASTQGWTIVSPNITPDPETGVMHGWSENKFIERMREGRVHMMSPMPWGPLSRLDSTDLKALYRFLQTVPAVKRENGQLVIPPEEDS